jgi:hypothetical protein
MRRVKSARRVSGLGPGGSILTFAAVAISTGARVISRVSLFLGGVEDVYNCSNRRRLQNSWCYIVHVVRKRENASTRCDDDFVGDGCRGGSQQFDGLGGGKPS